MHILGQPKFKVIIICSLYHKYSIISLGIEEHAKILCMKIL